MPDVGQASPESLAERILQDLIRQPWQKATEVARALGVDLRDVNRSLSHNFAGRVQQDSSYRWRAHEIRATTNPEIITTPTPAVSELARLCRYYLDCIGQDTDQGVSVFAFSKYDAPDYDELPALPMAAMEWDWWNAPGAARVLNKVRADRANLVAWVGYPVRLRRHRTAKWEG